MKTQLLPGFALLRYVVLTLAFGPGFSVFARDVAPPTIVCPSNITVSACGANGVAVPYPAPLASDNEGAPTIICTPPAGSVFPVGTHTVACEAVDAAGNRARCTFTVTVQVPPEPVIQQVSPLVISTLGGTPIKILGQNFRPEDVVLVDSTPLLNQKNVSATEIRGSTPPMQAGPHMVSIKRCSNIVARFPTPLRAAVLPTITSVEPRYAYTDGGTPLLLRGANLLSNTIVRFGFRAPDGTGNLLQKVRVGADGSWMTGIAPNLPAVQLPGPKAVIAEDSRGRTVLEGGINYVHRPEERDPQVLALRGLEVASQRRPTVQFRNGLPSAINLRLPVGVGSAEERSRNFLRSYRNLYQQVDPDRDLVLAHVKPGINEMVLFQQQHQSIPVYGGTLLVHLKGAQVFSVVGRILSETQLQSLNLQPAGAMPAATAEAAVRTALGLPNAPAYVPSRMVIFDMSLLNKVPSSPKLAWRVRLTGARMELFVDAQTGQVLFALGLEQQNGGALHDFDFDMQDAEGEANAADDDCFWTSDDTDIADEDWFNSDYNSDADAVQANQHARTTYGFFHENFNWHSYDNDSSQVEVFLHATVDNASWTPGCDLIQFKTGWVDLDVMAHEFTHGIISSMPGGGLIYAFESGALNESFADIMGAVCDQEDGDLNWTVAENRTSGAGAIRDLSNPPSFNNQPDKYSNYSPGVPVSLPWGDIYPDNGNVHWNSGIPNKTAFLMAVGQNFNGVPVDGMGRGKMRDLKFASLTSLPPSADFAAARALEVAIAESWADDGTHGFTDADVCTVRNAWAAVEIGNGDYDCDGDEESFVPDLDGDFIFDNVDNCPITPNPSQTDSDGDGVGNACDNCVWKANPNQLDTDNDGKGNECDTDDDNDGCLDNGDQHPQDSSMKIGTSWGICGNGDVFGFEGEDSDGDGNLNCEDWDDDNDGIPDDQDSCPIGEFGFLGCVVFNNNTSCFDVWYDVCMFGGCDELLLKFSSLINPDPTAEIVLDHFQIVNQQIYVTPNVGANVAQTALNIAEQGLAGAGFSLNGPAAAPGPADHRMRLEIWTRGGRGSPGHFMGVVSEFDPSTVQLGQILDGSLLMLTPPTDVAPMKLDAGWTIGARSDGSMADLDRDGLPDGWESFYGFNPRSAEDAMQDMDGDGATGLGEFQAGTDPFNAESVLRLGSIGLYRGGFEASFKSVFGKIYQLERSATLASRSWMAVGEPVVGTGGLLKLLDGAPMNDKSFYRIQLLAP